MTVTDIQDGRRRWTSEMEAMLREHFARRLTCSESAALLGVSRNAVIGKRTRLGLVSPPATPGDENLSQPLRRPGRDGAAMRFMLFRIARGRILPRFPLPDMATTPFDFVGAKVLAALGRHECRWPLQGAIDEADHTTLFCAGRRRPGSAYCERHHRLAHGQAQPDAETGQSHAA